MAITYTDNGTNTPNGSHLEFTYTFPVIQAADLMVALDGKLQATSKFTASISPAKITFNNTSIDSDLQESTGAPKTGVDVRVFRKTACSAAKAVYASGSSVRAQDLNNNHDQFLYEAQEAQKAPCPIFNDRTRVNFGDGDDLQIWHDPTLAPNGDNYIKSKAADIIFEIPDADVNGGSVRFRTDAATPETIAEFKGGTNPSCELYYNNVKTLETVSGGSKNTGTFEVTGASTLTGAVTVGGTFGVTGVVTNQDDVTFTGASNNAIWDKSDNALEFSDNAKATFGTGADLHITHDGTNSSITNATGNLSITNNAGNPIGIYPKSGELAVKAVPDGATELYYDNTKRFETTNTGVNITGNTVDDGATHDGDVTFTGASGNAVWDKSDNALELADNVKLKCGTSDDLEIFHNGSNSFIKDAGTGGLVVQTGLFEVRDPALSKYYIIATEDGSVELRHSNTKKFETTSAGAKVTGDLEVTGTVNLGAASVGGSELANDSIDSQHYVDGSIDTAHIGDNQVTTAKIPDDAITTAKLADAELTTLAGMQSGTASILADSTALTSTTAELNLLDGKSIVTTISASPTDVQIPTAQAVDERITTVVTDVGGFVPIANETSFPATNPDIDNGAGTIVSIKALASAITTGSGVTTKTIANGAGSGNTVTINGLTQNTTYPAGRGMLVETTSTLHTYTYHRLTLDESGVADAQAAIDDFDERYYGPASSAPTSKPGGGARADGDMYFDTTADKMKVWNNSATAWDDVATSASSFISTLSPAFDGSETEFTVSNEPVDAQSCIVSINGVIQKPNSGTSTPSEGFVQLANGKIKFAAAPASGADYFVITLGNAVSIGTPSPNTVGTTELENLGVTTAKIAADAVDGTKIADDAIDSEHYTDGSIDTAHLADNSVTAAKLADNAIASDAQYNTLAGTNAGDGFTGTDATRNTLIGYDAGTDVTNGDYNTAVGSYALENTTTGSKNVAIGDRALDANSTGSNNTAIGQGALGSNTTANDNTAVGNDALSANETGVDNIAIGNESLEANTTGSSNIALGYKALEANTTADNNIGIGRSALKVNTTGTNNVAVGAYALDANTTASYNTAVGAEALTSNTDGANNTAVGRYALGGNTDASANTAVGAYALGTNSTGSNNTAVGKEVLKNATTGVNNTAVGSEALISNTTGGRNVAVGYKALENNTTGGYNVAIGNETLEANTTASYNVAIGLEALTANTTGDRNVAIGKGAMESNTVGHSNTAVGVGALTTLNPSSNADMYNTAIGYNAGSAMTTGLYNTAVGSFALNDVTTVGSLVAIGYEALKDNTSGSSNVAVGFQAGRLNTTGGQNVAVGHTALQNATTAVYNTAVGATALNACTTGNSNTAVGREALQYNTTGYDNVAVGQEAHKHTTTGWGSVAIGHSALKNHTTGSENTAVGNLALFTVTTGNDNTAVGNEALEACTTGDNNISMGHRSGHVLTTGDNNVLLGPWAGDTLTTGSDNVCIGENAGAGQLTTGSGNLYIARSNVGFNNDACWIYGSDAGECYMGDNVEHWHTTSDQRLKKDIVDNTVGLSVIDAVKVRNFKYKQYSNGNPVSSDDTIDLSTFPAGTTVEQVLICQGKTGTQLGVIAQELETVCPNAVSEGPDGRKTVLSDDLFWHMINAIKELSTKVTALEAK